MERSCTLSTYLSNQLDLYQGWTRSVIILTMSKKNIVTNTQLKEVKDLFDQKIGSRAISKKLGITRWAVQQIYKELGVYNIGRARPRIVQDYTEYKCKICSI